MDVDAKYKEVVHFGRKRWPHVVKIPEMRIFNCQCVVIINLYPQRAHNQGSLVVGQLHWCTAI